MEAFIDLHAEALEEHGGAPGAPRQQRGAGSGFGEGEAAADPGLLGTAGRRIRPRGGFVPRHPRNHPFVGGNKRAGFLALLVTPGLNGLVLDLAEREAAEKVTAAASGELDDAGFRDWVARNSDEVPRQEEDPASS